MESCIFCQINNRKSPATIIFENSKIIVFNPIDPVSKGHTLVVPKEHFENILDIDPSVLKELILVSKDISMELTKKYKATGVNLLQASGKDAGQSVFNFHMHVVPRYKNDGLDLWLREKI